MTHSSRTRPPVAALFLRALRLRCPHCGGGRILRTWFALRTHCPACGLALDRGESDDFWLGAYAFNLVAAEVFSLLAVVIVIVARWPAVPWTFVQWGGVVLAVGMPVLFFPFSRTIWLAWDLAFRPRHGGDARE